MHLILKNFLIIVFAIVSMETNAQLFTATDLPTQNQLPVANVHCILQDKEGYMWYGTTGGGLCRDDGYQIDVFSSYNICHQQQLCLLTKDNELTR
jgi:ligand-binding sensor domain-containing protein